MVNVADAPGASEPIVQVLVRALKLPRLTRADSNRTPPGRVSTRVMLVAVSGPRLVTVIV